MKKISTKQVGKMGYNTLFAAILVSTFAIQGVYASDEGKTDVLSEEVMQKKTVNGQVTDAKTGEPVIGATLWIKETSTGDVSGAEGKYSISYSGANPVLIVSFLGYKNQEILINKQSTINIQLETDDLVVDEVVVTSYASQRKTSVIGAVTTVDVDKLKMPTSKVSSALAGNLAGVVAVQRSGEPGSGAEFYIRGVSTIGENKKPLILVDGIERSLDLVDTDDIQSFTVLKDATATAMYGVRGANGVMIITTKRGMEGKPQVNLRVESALMAPVKMPELANSVQFAEMYNEDQRIPYYSDEVMEMYRNGTDPDLYPSVDWIDALYKNLTSNQRANLSISGGGAVARYYVSGSFYNEGSIFKNDNMNDYNTSINYKRYNFRSNIDMNLSPTTIVSVSLANIFESKNEPGGETANVWSYSMGAAPNAYPIYYSNGQLSGPQSGAGENPYNVLTHKGYREHFWNNSQANLGINQDLKFVTEGLKVNAKFSWDTQNYNLISRKKTPNTFLAYSREDDGKLLLNETVRGDNALGYEKSNTGNRTTYLEANVTYDRVFGRHRVGALFLYNHREYRDLSADNAEASLFYRNQGLAARVSYSFDDRYFFEANMGYNGSENFSPGRRFGFFPAVAAGWILTNEKFMQGATKTLSLVKLKASYGKAGNDKIGGDRRFIYNSTILTKDIPGYKFGSSGQTNFNGLRVGEVANPFVGWEESTKLNVGLEVGLFNVLKISADYFSDYRSGIFYRRGSVPGIVGVPLDKLPMVNVAESKNKGFDATIEYDQVFGDWQISGQGSFTFNVNEVINNEEPDWKYLYLNRIGQAVGQPFGLVADGLFESEADIANSPKQTFTSVVRPGDIKYRDINGDGKIDSNDEVAIGRPELPQIIYGFAATAAYKGIQLGIRFQGVARTSIFLSGSAVRPFSNNSLGRSNFHSYIYDNHWTQANPNPNAEFPRTTAGSNANNDRKSTYWMRDASFLRIKDIELRYNFPRRICEKMKLRGLAIYATGNNLVTFSNFKLWDPEVGGGQGNAYPLMRTYNIGITINY